MRRVSGGADRVQPSFFFCPCVESQGSDHQEHVSRLMAWTLHWTLETRHGALIAVVVGVLIATVVNLLIREFVVVRRYRGGRYMSRTSRGLAALHELRRRGVAIAAAAGEMPGHRCLERRVRRAVFSERPRDETTFLARTVDKGKVFEFCVDLPEDDTSTSVDPTSAEFQAMVFALLHEMAHVVTASGGHPPEFYRHLRTLRTVAVQSGLFVPPDGKHVTFCGASIFMDT